MLKYLLLFILSFNSFALELKDTTYRVLNEQILPEDNIKKNQGTAVGIDLSKFGYMGKHYLLTAGHVVKHKDTIKETPYVEIKGKLHKCRVEKINEESDICLLFSKEELPFEVELSDQLHFEGLEEFILFGYPKGKERVKIDGLLLQFDTFFWVAKVENFNRGFSGGPVFYKDKVLGIIVAGLLKEDDTIHPEYAFFLPLLRIYQFLAE